MRRLHPLPGLPPLVRLCLPRIPGLHGVALTLVLQSLDRGRHRPRRKGRDRGGVRVEPNRPNTLSGGAAAALEFD